MSLPDKIRALRLRAGIGSQDDLAKRLGVAQVLVSGWERGKYLPKIPKVHAMARLFGVTADYLIDDDDRRTPDEIADEIRVREVAERIGWRSVYDRVIGAGHTPGEVATTIINGATQAKQDAERRRG